MNKKAKIFKIYEIYEINGDGIKTLYIGQTSQSLNTRFGQHLYNAFTQIREHYNYPISKSIREMAVDREDAKTKLAIRCVMTVSTVEEAVEVERELIKIRKPLWNTRGVE